MKQIVSFLMFMLIFKNVVFAEFNASQAITLSKNTDYYKIENGQIYKVDNTENTENTVFLPSFTFFSDIALEKKYLSKNITVAKDQKSSGDCWAFATCGAMETAILMKSEEKKEYDLSENHLKYIMSDKYGSPYGFDIDVGLGGIPPMTKSYLLYGPGFIENKYSSHTVSDIKEDYAITANYPTIDYISSGIIEVPNLSVSYRVGYNEVKQARIVEVKKLIKEHGAVFGSIYHDNKKQTYLKDNLNFYYTANEDGSFLGTNHNILIVGWDDNYGKENFAPVNGKLPESDGAFIIKNSWGTDAGDNGLFYLSYCDIYACYDINCISAIRKKYDNEIFNSYTGSGNIDTRLSWNGSSVIYYGNIFKRNYADEKLKSVMLYLLPGYSYEISVVFSDIESLSNGNIRFLDDVRGTSLFSIEYSEQMGYYTYNLETPLDIINDTYAIRVRMENLSGEDALMPVEVPSVAAVVNQDNSLSLKVMKKISSDSLQSFVYNKISNINLDLNQIQLTDMYTGFNESISYYTNFEVNAITSSELSRSQIDYMSIVNDKNQKITDFKAGSTVKIAPVVKGINLHGKDLVCAVYEGNRLVKAFTKTMSNNENVFEYKNIPSDFSNYTIKAFVLDFEGNITPLGNVKVYE